MPPPKLPADAPVADILVPGLERLGVAGGVEAERRIRGGAMRAARVSKRFSGALPNRSLTVAARMCRVCEWRRHCLATGAQRAATVRERFLHVGAPCPTLRTNERSRNQRRALIIVDVLVRRVEGALVG